MSTKTDNDVGVSAIDADKDVGVSAIDADKEVGVNAIEADKDVGVTDTQTEKEIGVSPTFLEWILDAVVKIKKGKHRPGFEYIARIITTDYDVTRDEVKEQLELAVQCGQILKIPWKDDYSYTIPATAVDMKKKRGIFKPTYLEWICEAIGKLQKQKQGTTFEKISKIVIREHKKVLVNDIKDQLELAVQCGALHKIPMKYNYRYKIPTDIEKIKTVNLDDLSEESMGLANVDKAAENSEPSCSKTDARTSDEFDLPAVHFGDQEYDEANEETLDDTNSRKRRFDKTGLTSADKYALICKKPNLQSSASRGPRSLVSSDHICLVCGATARSRNYGAMSCYGCKNFFERVVRRNKKYVCKQTGNCIIDPENRTECQACRFKKCLDVDMNPGRVKPEPPKPPKEKKRDNEPQDESESTSNGRQSTSKRALFKKPKIPWTLADLIKSEFKKQANLANTDSGMMSSSSSITVDIFTTQYGKRGVKVNDYPFYKTADKDKNIIYWKRWITIK